MRLENFQGVKISTHVSVRRRTYPRHEVDFAHYISTHVSVRRRTAKRINMLDLYFLIEQPQQQNGYHFFIKSLKIKIFSFQSMVRIP